MYLGFVLHDGILEIASLPNWSPSRAPSPESGSSSGISAGPPPTAGH